MELEVMKKLIRKYEPGHTRFSLRAMQAERYYRNETDILVKVKSEDEKKKEDSDNPLRNADNRIPRNFHGLIVNQKAAYMFTAPPLFDIGNEHGNEVVTEVLGDEYRKTAWSCASMLPMRRWDGFITGRMNMEHSSGR